MSTQYLVPGFGGVDESGDQFTQVAGFGVAESAGVPVITLVASNCAQAASADTGDIAVGQAFAAATSSQANSCTSVLVSVGGTLVSVPMVNNTNTVLANLAVTVYVHDPVTGALRVKKTGLTTDALGVWSFSDPAIAKSGPHRCVTVFDVGGAEGLDTYNGF